MYNRRILITQDKSFHRASFISGIYKAFSESGNNCAVWDRKKTSSFDMFDLFKPDLLIVQLENIDESLIRCLEENPQTDVCLEVKEDLLKSDIEKIDLMIDRTGKPDFIYTPNDINLNTNVKNIVLHNAADTFLYLNGKRKDEYFSDICYLGMYNKDINIDNTVGFLCKDFKYNIKIFGFDKWPYNQYCGPISNEEYSSISKSSNICLTLNRYDYIPGMVFNYLLNKCFVLSQHSFLQSKTLPKCCDYFSSQESLLDKVEHYLSNPNDKKEFIDNGFDLVLKKHTYFDRAITIFKMLKYETKNIENAKNNLLKEVK